MRFINIIVSSFASGTSGTWMLPPRELDSFKRLLGCSVVGFQFAHVQAVYLKLVD